MCDVYTTASVTNFHTFLDLSLHLTSLVNGSYDNLRLTFKIR